MTQQSPVIDVHAHIVFEKLHGAAGPHGPEAAVDEQGVNFFRIGEYQLKPLSYEGSVFIDMALRLEHMDRLGIDVQVLSANPLTMFHGIDAATATAFCQQQNDLMALAIAEHPERLLGLGSLPMQSVTASCHELERVVQDLGLSGVAIGTDFPGGFANPQLDPLYEALVALDVPLFVHPSSTDGVGGLADPRLGAHALSLSLGYAYEETLAVASIIMGGVLDRHPRLDICCSHGGGCVSFLAEKFEQIARFDVSVSEGVKQNGFTAELGRLWFDSHVKGDLARQLLWESVNHERLVFGTNLGGFDTPDVLGDEAALLADNAKKLLRLT
ncbi:amidohydrolase [Luminiphilus sp.]|nr:amidohydrolase [Luminiphilus sp.]